MDDLTLTRRDVLKALGAGALATAALPLGAGSRLAYAARADLITKPIPSSGERLPVIGMGTWRTFNVGSDPKLRNDRTQVLAAFFEAGGRLIDSSPMYGSSQNVVGYGLDKLGAQGRVFAADKVWTSDEDETYEQIAESRKEWRVARFDLMQVHNLLEWKAHLDKLQKLEADDKIRYVGITTSHGRRHDDFERVMKTEELDFVQLTYNMVDREAEERLLPLAAERGIAVIANRPFRGGALINRVQREDYPLPGWAQEIGCENWPQFLLKFVVSHPAVTCAIPATTKVEHMRENMGAARGELPDAATRKRMLAHLAKHL